MSAPGQARSERTIASGDAQLCTESFGDPGDPPVLLIMGQMASMLWWPEGFCERLAAAGRLVIRYDNRDTGRSTSYEPGQPPYTAADMTADAVAVLDGYDIDRGHLVGMSMGGGIAQLVALEHADRVATVTAMSTTAVGAPAPGLPGPDPAYLQHAAAGEGLAWSDTQAVAEFLVADARALAGPKRPFDEAAARELVTRDLQRTINPASLVNHALLEDDDDRTAALGELQAPLLVIHGTADPLFPHAHGEALANAVPNATLVSVDGGGHELHEGDWDQMVEAIRRHSATA